MIQLIASDMDGTLLDEQGNLPEGIFDRIRALKEKGVMFAAASGRQYDSLRRTFAPAVDDMVFVCENGGMAVTGDWRQCHYFDPRQAGEIMQDIMDSGLDVLVSTPDYCCLKSNARPQVVKEIVGKLHNTCVFLDDPLTLRDRCIKVSGFHPDDVAAVARPLQDKWRGKVNADLAGRNWLDFTLVNKAVGLELLSRRLGIPLSNMAAIGDQFNDVAMLQSVGRPFLMTTAPEALREMGFAPCRSVLETIDGLLAEMG